VFCKKDEVVLRLEIFKMRVKGLAKTAFEEVAVNGAFGDFGGDNKANSGKGMIRGSDFQAKEGRMMSGFGVESGGDEVARKAVEFRQHIRR